MEREALYARIEARVDAMVAAGAAAEVRAAAAAGASPDRPQGARLRGAARRATSRRCSAPTRRYAKRQLTWMRKLPGVAPVDVTGRAPDDVAAELHAALRAREEA